MLYSISGKNMTVRDSVREAIEKKLSRLDKYFSEDTEAKVVLSYTKDMQKIEVTIPTKLGLIRAEDESRDIISSIDEVADSIVAQIKKHKKKLISKRQSAASFSSLFLDEIDESDDAGEEQIRIVKTKHFAVKPMDPEEACLQMEMLGHSFFVFQDAQTDSISVVYKRRDGTYGLIEPEM